MARADRSIVPEPVVGVVNPAGDPAAVSIGNGTTLTAEDGRAYVVSNLRRVPMVREVDGERRVHLEPIALTLRRAIPKVRGKRARLLERRERAQLRRSSAHQGKVAAIAARLEREAPQVDW